MTFENMTVKTNIFNVGKQPVEVEKVHEVNLIIDIVQEYVDSEFIKDPLEKVLAFSEHVPTFRELEDDKLISCLEANTVMTIGQWFPNLKY